MKGLILKLVLLFILVVLVQLIVGHHRFEIDSRIESLDMQLKEGIDTLYLGDCTNTSHRKWETDRRTLASILEKKIPGHKLGVLTYNSYHMEIYLEFIRYIAKSKHRLKRVIIPINLRSFSPSWDRMPQYQFEKEKILLKGGMVAAFLRAFYRPLRLLGIDWYTISREEYLDTPVFKGTIQWGKVRDYNRIYLKKYSKEDIKGKILLFYMFSLSQEHRKIHSMISLARIGLQNNIQILFYITPIDYQSCEGYFPGEFTKRINENSLLIKNLLKKENTPVLDLSTALDSSCFTWTDTFYPNEQLNIMGREKVAEYLSLFLKEQIPNFKYF